MPIYFCALLNKNKQIVIQGKGESMLGDYKNIVYDNKDNYKFFAKDRLQVGDKKDGVSLHY